MEYLRYLSLAPFYFQLTSSVQPWFRTMACNPEVQNGINRHRVHMLDSKTIIHPQKSCHNLCTRCSQKHCINYYRISINKEFCTLFTLTVKLQTSLSLLVLILMENKQLISLCCHNYLWKAQWQPCYSLLLKGDDCNAVWEKLPRALKKKKKKNLWKRCFFSLQLLLRANNRRSISQKWASDNEKDQLAKIKIVTNCLKCLNGQNSQW